MCSPILNKTCVSEIVTDPGEMTTRGTCAPILSVTDGNRKEKGSADQEWMKDPGQQT